MKYKKRTEISAELGELISLVNILPNGAELPNPKEIENKILREKFDSRKETEDIDEVLYQGLLQAFEKWREQLKEMLETKDLNILEPFFYKSLPKSEYPDTLDGKISLLYDLLNSHSRFKNLQLIFSRILERVEEHKLAYKEFGESVFSWQEFDAGFVTLLAFGKEGRIDFGIPKILEPFKGCELVRFKRCVICEKIFYAKKINAETCDAPCAKTLFNWKRLAKLKGESLNLKQRRIEHQKQQQKSRSSNQKTNSNKKGKRDEKQRRLEYYKENGIRFCPNCVHPVNTCECKEKK